MRIPLFLILALAASPARSQELTFSSEKLGSIFAQADALRVARRERAEGAGAMGRGARAAIQALGPVEDLEKPDPSAYKVRGVDVSHYEGAIDWKQVAGAGITFAYMKATEGGDYVDDTFAKNWTDAASAGVARGAYHFYNFCRDAKSQAANFVAHVPADSAALPPTIDLEESDSCRKLPKKAAFRKDFALFIAKIRSFYGRTPVLYINYSLYEKYFQGEKDGYLIWIADISHKTPSMPDSSAWTFWQYDWHSRVPGIATEVDVDAFNGPLERLAALDRGSDVMLASLR